MLRVFLSYSRRDAEFARRLAGALSHQDIEAWVDWNDIPPSAEWLSEILQAIENSHAFVFVLTPDSASSQVCVMEAAHAIKHNKRIVALMRRPGGLDQLPRRLSEIQWIPFDDDASFENSLLQVTRAVLTDALWLQRHTNLTILASLWERRARDPSSLLRGSPLADAEAWIYDRDPETQPLPSALQIEFINTSRRHADLTSAENIIFAVQSMIQRLHLRGADGRLQEAEVLLARHSIESLPAKIARWQIESLKPSLIATFRSSKGVPSALCWIPGTSDFLVHGQGWLQRWSSVSGEVLWNVEMEPHRGAVMTVSESGEQVAVAAENGWILVFGLQSGQRISAWPAHDDDVTALSFSNDGLLLASGGFDASVRCWQLPEASLLQECLGHRSPVSSVSLSPDGTLLASGSFGMHYHREQRAFNLAGHHVDKSLRIWLTATARELVTADFELGISHLKFLPDGRRVLALATNPFNGAGLGFHIWNAHTGELLQRFGKQASPLAGISLSQDGMSLMSADSGGLDFWQINSGRLVGRGELSQDATGATAIQPDGTVGATSTEDGAVHLWQLRRSSVRTISMTDEGSARSFAISADSLYLAAATDSRLEDWGSIGFMREETQGSDHPIRVIDLPTGVELVQLRHHRRGVHKLAFTHDGRGLISSDAGGTLVHWDVLTASIVNELGNAFWFALSSEGDKLLTWSDKAPIHLLTFPDLKSLMDIPLAGSTIHDAAFSQDGQQIIVATDGEICAYETGKGRKIRTFETSGAEVKLRGIAIRNGAIFCATHQGTVSRWEIESGAGLRPVTGTEGLVTYDLSLDGKVLACGVEEGPIRLLDLETSQLIAELDSGEAAVGKVAFAPDNSAFVAGGDDGKLRVWLLDFPQATAAVDQAHDLEYLSRIGEYRRATRQFLSLPASERAQSDAILAALLLSKQTYAALKELDRFRESAAFPLQRWQLWHRALTQELPRELAEAVEIRDLEKVDELLTWDPQIANRRMDAPAALHVAASNGDEDMVKRLLAMGASPELDDGDGWTPLHCGAFEGRDSIVEVLIASGANVNAKSKRHLTPLHLAAKKGQTATMKLLIHHGGDIESKTDDGWTPLHEVVESTDWALRTLLEAGALPNASTYAGYTPLHRAAHMDKATAVSILVDAGCDINQTDDAGLNALHFAASKAGLRTIEYLLRLGANPHLRDRQGLLPIDYAVNKKNFDVAERLQKAMQQKR
jgi:WD40 repeat protein/ankyrin repeat protein